MPTRQRIQSRPELVRNTLITLNDFELEIAEFIGKRRNSENRSKNVYDNRYKKNDSIEIDVIGTRTELAFGKLINSYPHELLELGVKSKKLGTDFGDYMIDNMSVDVKGTKYKTGRLLIPAKSSRPENIDMFCLLTKEEENSFYLRGFYPVDLIYEKTPIKNFGRPSYTVEQKELLDYDDCLKKVLDIAA